MLPTAVTDAAIASELPGAIAWAERHHIAIDTRLRAEKTVRVALVQEEGDEAFYLQGGVRQLQGVAAGVGLARRKLVNK